MLYERFGERYRAAGRDLWVFQKQGEMIRPEEAADLIAYILHNHNAPIKKYHYRSSY